MKRHLLFSLILGACLAGGALAPRPAAAQGGGTHGQVYDINEKGEPVAKPGAAATDTAQAPSTGTTSAAAPTSGTMSFLRQLEAKNKNIKTIHATFDQERMDEVFQEKVKSTGELWFDKPNRFRADYADPTKTTTLILDDALYMYTPELQQVDYWTFQSPAERDEQLHKLLIAFGFRAEDLVKDYEIHSSVDEAGPQAELKQAGFDPAKTVLLVIKPRAATAESSPFNLLKVYIDKASLLPQKIWYRDQNAEMTLTMKKIDLDVPLDSKLFDKNVLFPKGTEYIDKRNAQ